MLVLSRKSGQQIRIGDEIILSVVQVQGGRVKIGIEAPQKVQIRREELAAGPRGRGPLVAARLEQP